MRQRTWGYLKFEFFLAGVLARGLGGRKHLRCMGKWTRPKRCTFCLLNHAMWPSHPLKVCEQQRLQFRGKEHCSLIHTTTVRAGGFLTRITPYNRNKYCSKGDTPAESVEVVAVTSSQGEGVLLHSFVLYQKTPGGASSLPAVAPQPPPLLIHRHSIQERSGPVEVGTRL